jgi:hypothetical protein
VRSYEDVQEDPQEEPLPTLDEATAEPYECGLLSTPEEDGEEPEGFWDGPPVGMARNPGRPPERLDIREHAVPDSRLVDDPRMPGWTKRVLIWPTKVQRQQRETHA